MAVPLDKLLAIKAFYLGYAASENPTTRVVALEMIGAAIEQLRGKTDRQSPLRAAFYCLVRAEILRVSGDPTEDRMMAQKICASVGSALYLNYMLVEQATMSIKRLYGINALVIGDEGIKRKETVAIGRGLWTYTSSYDIACRALMVDQSKLSKQEIRFLHEVNLKQLLVKHEISYGS